ncbi:unnamed protein product, partial [Closterium sp. Naga37s-1]
KDKMAFLTPIAAPRRTGRPTRSDLRPSLTADLFSAPPPSLPPLVLTGKRDGLSEPQSQPQGVLDGQRGVICPPRPPPLPHSPPTPLPPQGVWNALLAMRDEMNFVVPSRSPKAYWTANDDGSAPSVPNHPSLPSLVPPLVCAFPLPGITLLAIRDRMNFVIPNHIPKVYRTANDDCSAPSSLLTTGLLSVPPSPLTVSLPGNALLAIRDGMNFVTPSRSPRHTGRPMTTALSPPLSLTSGLSPTPPLACVVSLPPRERTPCHQRRDELRNALLAIRDGMNFVVPSRSPKAYWTANDDCSYLFGVNCNDQGNVIVMYLFNALGPLPAAIGNLTFLSAITTTGNLTTLPTEFSKLTKMTFLSMSRSGITGPFPTMITALPKLKDVKMINNSMSGPIPVAFSALTNLIVLRLDVNKLTGSIPAGLSRLVALTQLNLKDNLLTGVIPPSLSALKAMQTLDFRNNKLTGTIPSQLSALTNLDGLYLSNNTLTGAIPSQLKTLTNLRFLNALTGSVPASVSSFASLIYLSASYNKLSGSLPAGLSSLAALQYLGLANNTLTGSIPSALSSLGSLAIMFLHHNSLTGSLPLQLSELTSLFSLDLSYNKLNGTLPPIFTSSMQFLGFLHLSHNFFTGPLPSNLATCQSLYELDVSNNYLSGIVAPVISSLTSLQTLDLSVNYFTGPVPPMSSAPLILHYSIHTNYFFGSGNIVDLAGNSICPNATSSVQTSNNCLQYASDTCTSTTSTGGNPVTGRTLQLKRLPACLLASLTRSTSLHLSTSLSLLCLPPPVPPFILTSSLHSFFRPPSILPYFLQSSSFPPSILPLFRAPLSLSSSLHSPFLPPSILPIFLPPFSLLHPSILPLFLPSLFLSSFPHPSSPPPSILPIFLPPFSSLLPS